MPWLWFAIAMVAVGAVVLMLVWRPTEFASGIPEDTNSARPTGSQWNELESPTKSPTDDDFGGGEVVDCPQNSSDYRSEVDPDGRIRGGGLSFEARPDWNNQVAWLPWLYDHNYQTRTITSMWVSHVSVGVVHTSEGFTSPRHTAESLMSCMASSDLFLGFSGRDDLYNDSFRLDGKVGWRVTSNVFVDNQGDIKGDVVDIIVLDLGDEGKYSVFTSAATIDHEENLQEVAEATESLRVE